MSDKSENFVVTMKGENLLVERFFELPNGDHISYKQTISLNQLTDDVSMFDLHRMSADMVIRYLLQFLPEGYDKADPYTAGKPLAPT